MYKIFKGLPRHLVYSSYLIYVTAIYENCLCVPLIWIYNVKVVH